MADRVLSAPRIERWWLLLGLVGCGESTPGGVPDASASVSSIPSAMPSASAMSSPSSRVPPNPVDAYCDAIEAEWKTVDADCSAEQRTTADYAQARTAAMAAVAKCKALLGPSYGAGHLAFEQKRAHYVDHDCHYARKYEWAALGALTRLLSNCSPKRLAGLVSDGSRCSYSFECRSGICAGPAEERHCKVPPGEGEDCSTVEPTHLGGPNWSPSSWRSPAICKPELYCDRDPPPALLAGYPPGTRSQSSDYPIRAGRVSIEALSEGAAPKPDIAKWSKESRPFLVRCFEAALAKDAKTKGVVTLELPLEGRRSVVASDLPDELRDCALSVTHGHREWAGRVRVRFDAAPSDKPLVPRARTGKCRPVGVTGQACELNSECMQGLACVERKCAWDGPRDCTTDGDCWLTERCMRGQCLPRRGVGGTCEISAECLAGICEEGVCKAMCASKAGPRFDPD